MLRKHFYVLLTVGCIIAAAAGAPALSPVTITEMVICKGIQDREPLEPGNTFPADVGEVYCFTRSSAETEGTIAHVWYLEGEKRFELSLHVGASPSWRTNSSKIIRPSDTGSWKVEVVGAGGEVLKTAEFVIE